ncbi:KpsF/GutQ family sugar-phosphate isomerase [Motiliproteus coralliicola]|uniref:Arabinose 5-phosphate isomerase n=1 Tax=Motiliproteus coralliicola TaxID=2283196 RepID=A0A369WJZ2_9GAMM|nr:KpsF/GutQ family sugar-phosphate isomerase [Motiliproteus coralliicola]RDE19775.1 KpsF/GutQ family sugar-phosphate isomerase [Motiliproteus coralliicola]
MSQIDTFIQSARRTLQIEAESVAALQQQLDQNFSRACELALNCRGRVIVTGMGKSGHIGKKIAATLASTGTPSFYVHPGEASHGDMGMITSDDVVVALSNSGSTAEVVTLLPLLKRLGSPLISITGKPDSTLSQAADANLDVSVKTEACPLGLAPTSSTTAALAIGDALAIALLEARGFSAEDFAFSHPGGALGRKLLLKVKDLMHSGDRLPVVDQQTSLSDTLLEISRQGLGMSAVIDEQKRLVGVFTDGDLRRTLDLQLDLKQTPISQVMTRQAQTTTPESLAAEALHLMEEKKINGLIVIDDNQHPVGALNMHDLLRAGVL